MSGCIQHPSAHGFREWGEINKCKERFQFQGKEIISSSNDPGHHHANNGEGAGMEAGKEGREGWNLWGDTGGQGVRDTRGAGLGKEGLLGAGGFS